MQLFPLRENYYLGIEDNDTKFRFIVFQNKKEWICRMEKKSVLRKFFQQKKGRIFKGRLQLEIFEKQLFVEAKGQWIGVLDLEKFYKKIMF